MLLKGFPTKIAKGKIINIFANKGLKLKLQYLLKSSHGTGVANLPQYS
jgi:hypothetical protein